jgi:hypothetical protein|uniref:CopG n=1 Tax=Lacticaseibacillus paracasei TaxID=1597 RepID=K7YE08_LACPA|nr:ribbon-helix-helix protein, CopG family [Lacticaseibacillus paracasei]AFX97739.1 CopG [Lacticaseibacillus paracasei]
MLFERFRQIGGCNMSVEEKKRIMISLSSENAELLAKMAREMGLSKSALVTIWINANKTK